MAWPRSLFHSPASSSNLEGAVPIQDNSPERLAVALDAGRLGVWEWNLVTNQVWWSDNLEEIHGLPKGSFHGTLAGFQSIVHPEDRERVAQAIDHALATKSEYEIEFRAIKPDGGFVWIGGKGRIMLDAAGKPARMVGSAIDITERRRVHDALRALLRVSERLNSTLDVNGIIDVLVEEAIRLADAESGFAGLATPTGMVCRTYVRKGQTMPLQYVWPPNRGLPGWVLVHKRPYLTNDVAHDHQIDQDLVQLLDIHAAVCVPIIDAGGSVLGFFEIHNKSDGTGFTIPSQQRLMAMAQTAAIAVQNALAYRKVREGEIALKEADRRKDEFLAMLAHELRNPLAPITNSLEILRLVGPTEGPAVPARDVLERQVRQMVRLIDDLLDVNRITHNKLELQRERIELRAVLESAIETSAPYIHAEGRNFSVSLPPTPCWLDGDLTRLSQVFSNLLNNAAKYTRQGDRIWLAAECHDTEVVVTVGDTGIGLAPEDRVKLFELFVQVGERAQRIRPGLGIGLALARRLVDLHGGSLDVESRGLGKGSEFTVRLPMID